MQRLFLLAGCISLLLAGQAPNSYAACAAHVAASPAGTPAAVPGELLVTFRSDVPPARARAISAELGATVVRTLSDGRIQQVRVPAGASLNTVTQQYLSRPEVEAAEPNHIIRAR